MKLLQRDNILKRKYFIVRAVVWAQRFQPSGNIR